MPTKVDPDALRAWASWLDGVSEEFTQISDDVTVGYGAKFPGTGLEAVLNETRDSIKGALNSLSSRATEMADIARGNSENYEITDVDFSARLDGMGGLT
ncbi:WXG100 family type VII secretion target [Nocardia carnea]|uniref:ESX-1 secretion-associated protein n=1 Tax=Nocardia carnea TaxID=37328 RepID=A0ABW7TZ40_9NOCA|nr:ESX-1 secretion-associated protein [Nocardia carnea]